MHRNVTAVYRTREVAETVRRALEDIDVPARDIHIVPDPAHDAPAGRAAEPRADDRDSSAHYDRLHALHLPEEDVRTYQHCVRRGDYVVSAEVDEDEVEKVKAVMRRPETEAWDIEHRASEFRDETLVPHSAGEGHMLNEDRRARRLAIGDDGYTRTYERDRRLEGRDRI